MGMSGINQVAEYPDQLPRHGTHRRRVRVAAFRLEPLTIPTVGNVHDPLHGPPAAIVFFEFFKLGNYHSERIVAKISGDVKNYLGEG